MMTAAERSGPTEPFYVPMSENHIWPHDFDAEQAVIGSILIETEAVTRALAIVDPSDFYSNSHQVLMQAIVRCRERQEPVDLVTLSAELRRQRKLDEVGGGQYLTALIGEVPTAAHVVRYATIVAEKAMLRNLIKAGQQIQDLGFANPEDVGGAVREAEGYIAPISGRLCRPMQPALRSGVQIEEHGSRTAWLWEKWLLDGQLNVMIAPPDAGKTYAALGRPTCGDGCKLAGREPLWWPDGASAVP